MDNKNHHFVYANLDTQGVGVVNSIYLNEYGIRRSNDTNKSRTRCNQSIYAFIKILEFPKHPEKNALKRFQSETKIFTHIRKVLRNVFCVRLGTISHIRSLIHSRYEHIIDFIQTKVYNLPQRLYETNPCIRATVYALVEGILRGTHEAMFILERGLRHTRDPIIHRLMDYVLAMILIMVISCTTQLWNEIRTFFKAYCITAQDASLDVLDSTKRTTISKVVLVEDPLLEYLRKNPKKHFHVYNTLLRLVSVESHYVCGIRNTDAQEYIIQKARSRIKGFDSIIPNHRNKMPPKKQRAEQINPNILYKNGIRSRLPDSKSPKKSRKRHIPLKQTKMPPCKFYKAQKAKQFQVIEMSQPTEEPEEYQHFNLLPLDDLLLQMCFIPPYVNF